MVMVFNGKNLSAKQNFGGVFAFNSLQLRQRDECDPHYRDGNLGGEIVLGAVLRLEVAEKAEVAQRTREYLSEKSAAQPVTERSCGCVFKNPDPERSDGRSAGELIDDCGGKGLRRGAAVVSPKHGNFIVNLGRATAVDVFALIEDMRDLVREKCGVELEQEARVWRSEVQVTIVIWIVPRIVCYLNVASGYLFGKGIQLPTEEDEIGAAMALFRIQVRILEY